MALRTKTSARDLPQAPHLVFTSSSMTTARSATVDAGGNSKPNAREWSGPWLPPREVMP